MSFDGATASPLPVDPCWPAGVQAALAAMPPARAAALRPRLAREFPRLHDRLQRLYGRQPGFDAFLDGVLCQALRCAAEREPALWQLDLDRERQPEWLHAGLLGYCAYVDKFAGSLCGVAQRVPYLQELGVRYLHLLPFLKAGSPPNDGGFAVASFEAVEPALGTQADLPALCRTLRAAGISLCSDFVLNHVSHEHPWAQAALAGDPAYLDYFHWRDSAEAVAAQERHLGQVFPGTAPGNFTWVEARQAWVWTTFYPYQWDLNYANPAVFAEIAAALLKLANQGVEAFRLDSTGYLWKREGSNCLNQPEIHLILQALRALCALAAPGVVLKAEAIMPTRELPPYFGLGPQPGPECQVAYHASLMAAAWLALAEGEASAVREVLRHTPDLPEGCLWLSYVRCHDDIGWNVLRPELSALGSEPVARLARASRHYAGQGPDPRPRGRAFQAADEHAVHGTNGMTLALAGLPPDGRDPEPALARMQLLHALSFFVGGLPLIYMGEELGQDNVGEAELQARQGPDGRELHRPAFDAAAAARRHDPQHLAGRCFAMLRRLQRDRLALLPQGRPVRLRLLPAEAPGLLALARDGVIGLFNFGETACTADLRTLAQGPLQTLDAEGRMLTVDPQQPLTLPGHAALWLRPPAA